MQWLRKKRISFQTNPIIVEMRLKEESASFYHLKCLAKRSVNLLFLLSLTDENLVVQRPYLRMKSLQSALALLTILN